MRRLLDALPLLLTLIIALTVTVNGGYKYYTINTNKQLAFEENTKSPTESAQENKEVSGETETLKNPESNQSGSQTDASSEPPAIETAGGGTAVGKIVKQFISPYSAKYSYNNVYMKNTSGINIDLKSELAEKLQIKIKKSAEPEVLIVHTHATECYMSEDRDYYTAADAARSTDASKNMLHIGELVKGELEAAGIGVVHATNLHDYPSYNSSYSRAAVTIKEYLAKYPSIKVVIDIHRDSIGLNETDRARPVAEIDGKEAAQVMLVMGSESGTIKNFPNWRQNFRLAARFQQTMEVMYPGLARPLVLASKLYNENLTTGSMLLEVGTESNTLSEAEYSASLVGKALANLLNTLG